MIGTPIQLPFSAINKIAEAVKLAETATDLEFRTQYKISRLGNHIEPMTKSYAKLKAQITRKYQASEQTKEDVAELQKASDDAEAMLEEVTMPEFLMSEFVSVDKGKEKLKVSQAFLNRMFPYITDDIVEKK
jgi:predicted  nucleic acid-binding Zn-ribbon protein